MKLLLTVSACLLILTSMAQPNKKPVQQQPASQSQMDKMLEDAMKTEGMSKEEQAEMKKMMKDVMPGLAEQNAKTADYPEFNNNRQLVPKKDMARINALSKKRLTQADMSGYAVNLYNKLITKGEPAQMAIVKKVIAQTHGANDIGNAAMLCMMQGHPQAAMALSMKAVQSDPSNANWQNNMAALLTNYGYPEQAIPVLNKLKSEFPYNSTVLNNIGQAWFSLGDIDSAKRYFSSSSRINPYHPDAKLCGGLLEELNGDPIKAVKDYTEAMENSPNPFIDKILKNKAGDKGFEKIDFEKLKRSITIYEYFPRDWIKIPVLSDNVSGYENDMRIKNGYSKMFEELKEKIETASEAAEQEMNLLMNKGQDEFVKTMAKESMKGINKMSLTAVTVQKILQIYMAQWAMDNMNEYMALKNKISARRTELAKTGKNDKCPDFDRKNNEFLAYANPLIRKYHEEKIEAFRNWLNAFCTWIWYITGNPKNTVMAMCIGWTEGLENLYESAVQDQDAEARSCVQQNGDGSSFVPTPDIPNFSCPTLVKIPLGNDWQELSNGVKDFNANSLGIKTNPAYPVPNHTIAYGGGSRSIAEPGKAPFVQSANGSVAPGMINSDDDELTPLSKIPLDDLTPLSPVPPDDLVALPDLRRSKFLKDLLKKMMTADCNNIKSTKDKLKEQLDRMTKKVKELEAYENLIEQIKKLEEEIEQKEADGQKKEQLKKQIQSMQQETEKMDTYEQVQASKKEIEKIIKEMDAMDDKQFMKEKFDKITQLVDQMEATPAIAKDIQQNGLQASVSSGVQVPGTFTPNKTLFQ